MRPLRPSTEPTASTPGLDAAGHGRRAARLLGVVLALLMSFVLGTAPALACDCIERTVEEAVGDSDLVARGVIVGIIEESDSHVVYEVFLYEVWKGEEVSTVRLSDTLGQTNCDAEQASDVGTPRFLFVRGSKGSYTWGTCAAQTEVSRDELPARLTEETGEPWVNPGTPTFQDPGDRPRVDRGDQESGAAGDEGAPVLLLAAVAVVGVLVLGATATTLTVFLLWYARRPR